MKRNDTKKATRLWRLDEVMRWRDIRSIAELQRLLEPHLDLSYYQTRRLILGQFVNAVQTLDALCFVLHCDVSDVLQIAYTDSDSSPVPLTAQKLHRRRKARHVDVIARLKPLGDPTGVDPLTIDFSTIPRAKT